MKKSSRNKLKASILFYLILISLAIISFSATVYAIEPGDNQVILYEHSNYGGSYIILTYNRDVNNISSWHTDSGESWNDKVSSIKVGKNTKVILYQDKDYKGSAKTIQGDCSASKNIPNLNSISWNDKVTSLKVMAVAKCPTDYQVILYEHNDYEGAYIIFDLDATENNLSSYNISSGKNWNDKASSIKVGKKAKVTLYKHKDCNDKEPKITIQGSCNANKNYASLGSIEWNDMITSLKVRMADCVY